MDDQSRLEEEKDRQKASLAAKIEALDALAKTKKAAFETQTRHLIEIFEASVERLESGLSLHRGKLLADVKEKDSQLKEWEARLKNIIAETELPGLDKKLKALEASLMPQNAYAHSLHLEAAGQDLKALEDQMQERLSQKEYQVVRLKEELALKEQEISKTSAALQFQRQSLIAKCKGALQKKEKAAREAINYLEMELAKRTRRFGEVEKIVEARESWLEGEKKRRLESLKALMAEVESHGKEFRDAFAEEKNFWESAIKNIEEEIKKFNLSLVTEQAQLNALKARHQEEILALEAAHQGEFQEKEKIFMAEVLGLRAQVEESNAKIKAMVAALKTSEEGHRQEMTKLEALCQERREEVSREIKENESRLAALRREHAQALKSKSDELSRLRGEFEAKIVAPATQAKKKHLAELESKINAFKEKMAGIEASHASERDDFEKEIESCQEEIRLLEEKLTSQARLHKDTVAEIAEKESRHLAPYLASLGELKKAMEIAQAKNKEEVGALEAKKSGLQLEAEHLRSAFESSAEEKRRELLFALDNLKAHYEAQKGRLDQERNSRVQALEAKKREIIRLENEIKVREESFSQERLRRELEIKQSSGSHQAAIKALGAQLSVVHKENEELIAEKRREVDQAEEKTKTVLAGMQEKWTGEQFGLEKEKTRLMAQLSKEAEDFAQIRDQLKDQDIKLSEALAKIEGLYKEKSAEWDASARNLEQARLRQVAPLERERRHLEELYAKAEREARERLEPLEEKISTAQRDLEGRKSQMEKEMERKKDYLGQEIGALDMKLRSLGETRLKSVGELERRVARGNAILMEKEKALASLAASLDAKRQGAEDNLRREEQAERDLLIKAQSALEASRRRLEKVEASRNEALHSILSQAQRQEDDHLQRVSSLELQGQKQKEEMGVNLLEGKEALAAKIKELEDETLRLDKEIKEGSLQVDVLKSQQDLELSEIERSYRRSQAENKFKRASIAEELRQVRRGYREKLREKEHEIYLVKLKVDLRSKRLEEFLQTKQKELLTSKEKWAQDAASSLETLKSKIDQLGAARQSKRERLEQLRMKASKLQGEHSGRKDAMIKAQAFSFKEFPDGRSIFEDRIQRQMEQFRRRMEELLKIKETERAKLLENLQIIDPLGRELTTSLSGFLGSWEREVRRLHSLIKSVEENPFWRHH